jgi:hypothetical protein
MPLMVWAATADALAAEVHHDTRRYLMSRESEVLVDLERMRGEILCGFNSGGSFTIEAVHQEASDA